MRFGHDTTMPLRVPPKSEGTCFIHPKTSEADTSTSTLLPRTVVVPLIAAPIR